MPATEIGVVGSVEWLGGSIPSPATGHGGSSRRPKSADVVTIMRCGEYDGLKTNTSKRREHSLFRQGCMVYDLIPTMPERWLQPLMLAFTRLLDQQPLFSRTLGLV